MDRRIPVLICIDAEPDARDVCLRGRVDWHGFEQTCGLFSEYRPQAERATGGPARFNWFLRMDPQIAAAYGSPGWAASHYAAEFSRLFAAGDELGLHTHPWRWDEGLNRWVADFGDQAWVSHCVRVSFDTFEAAFGRRCVSFRFGDRWTNEETLQLVEELGAEFDLTMEPGRPATAPALPAGDLFTGAFPDYTRVPREPYRPSPSDFTVDGGTGGLWVVPQSTGLLPAWPPARLYRRAVWRLRYGPRQYLPLSPGLDPVSFRRLADDILYGSPRPYLCLPLRSNDATHPDRAGAMRANLEALLAHPLAGRFSFATPVEAVELLVDAVRASEK
jgi:peptidoglycan/xylan/chitin deacetylase (PgdA/CDA1 family)